VTVTLLIVAGVFALGDWAAVHDRRFRLEYVLKPLTLGLFIAAAISADLGVAQPWVVAALGFGLLGDIGLMLSHDGRADPPFIAGLAAFLVGHVCYLVGFLRVGVRSLDLLAGLLVVLGVAGLALPAVLRGASRAAGPQFAVVVGVYSAVLSAMTVLAVGTGIVATAIGGALFLASDTLIARERFVAPVRRGPLLVIATYHLAQFLILVGLIKSR
jgi:uncharacterized membrane protein YhhN